jgi:hypothetical protein
MFLDIFQRLVKLTCAKVRLDYRKNTFLQCVFAPFSCKIDLTGYRAIFKIAFFKGFCEHPVLTGNLQFAKINIEKIQKLVF